MVAENALDSPPLVPSTIPVRKGTIEDTYQKLSQLEHVLKRPDTYIGSVQPIRECMWVYDKEKQRMLEREVTYVPGLYKIFDEILVNAADNKIRDSNMNRINIKIDPEKNEISVWNNGKGIPIVEHKNEKMFVPTLIFGHLLTSANFNDEEQKMTGGRNGYGAKLCNIFSTRFTIETSSKEYKKYFKQTWSENMTKVTNPVIKERKDEDYTKVTFSPDLSKFGMTSLDDDIVLLMTRRAYDVAASTRGVKVYLNNELLPVKCFKDYVDLYIKDIIENDVPLKVVYDSVNPRWEVAITFSPSGAGFRQMSFVNSIATTKGGRHVDYITDMIVKHVMEVIKKKHKGANIKPHQIKHYLWIFINCLIVNPAFDSQTKENLTTQVKNFGSKCVLSEKFIASVSKSGIIDRVLNWLKDKEQSELSKTSGKKQSKLKGIPKLEDANDAGSNKSIDCTLILTEGDSAKTLAVSGLGIVGRDKYGVFPLRGKLLNVREASCNQIRENLEIVNLVKIIGLQYHKKYETIDDLKTLRYGRVMIMTDQDQDGSHIKGLIINFIHHNWPSLLKLPFLEEFITPIIKATKGKNEELSFFSIPEFDEWKNQTSNWHTYKIKYYKGLGTSTSKEAKEYFSNMERHRILFKHRGEDDDENIIMAFSKKKVQDRKQWLTEWMMEQKRRQELGLGEDYLYAKDTRAVTYSDFINKELVLFSNMDNERSIPSAVDGLKPGSRKVLFTCLKRNDKREIKVAQLAGSVAEHSAYHHGEQSLMSTIINLAQNYVGSNNINLLQPIGQFGTRLQGGKDAASPRYIFTMLSPLTRLIFHPNDDPLLKYLKDDNLKIEPVWYIPVIPMVLVNGADGIGTGWMTKIPNHNPVEIISNLRRMMRGDEPLLMKPWYKNFHGDIEKYGDTRYVTIGEIATLGEDKIEITELPIGVWTQAYKEQVLEVMLHGSGEKVKPSISNFKEYNTDTTVKFVVSMSREQFRRHYEDGFHKAFKLQTTISTTSMCAFDKDSVLTRYDVNTHILKEFFTLRLEYYGKRKDYLEGMLNAEALKLANQARFIVEKCDGDLRIENRKRKEMIKELVKRGYDSDPVRQWKINQDRESALDEEQEEEKEEGSPGTSEDSKDDVDYEYLLGMKMWALTLERKNELIKKKDEKHQELDILKKKTPSDLWNEDLDAILIKLEELEIKEREDEASTKPIKVTKGKEKGTKKKIALATDTLPSPAAVRVIPKLDEELIKKLEQVQVKKEKKEKSKGKNKEDGTEELGEDGMPLEGKPIKEQKKRAPKSKEPKEPKEPKNPKADKNSKGVKEKGVRGRKKKNFSDSDESDTDSDIFKADTQVINTVDTPVRSVSRRAAAANVRYNIEENSSESEEFFDNDLNNRNTQQQIVGSSDEANDAFDGMNGNTNEDGSLSDKPSKSASTSFENASDSDFDGNAKASKKPTKRADNVNAMKKKLFSNADGKSATTTKKVTKPKSLKKEFSSDSEDEKPVSTLKRPIKAKPILDTTDEFDPTAHTSTSRSSEEIFDSLLKDEAAKKDNRRARQVTKSKYVDSDSEIDEDFEPDGDSEDDYVPQPKKPKGVSSSKSKPAGTKQSRKKKVLDSDSD